MKLFIGGFQIFVFRQQILHLEIQQLATYAPTAIHYYWIDSFFLRQEPA